MLEIIRTKVKPERDRQKRKALRERWWQYAEKRPGLYKAIRELDWVLVTDAAAVLYHMIARIPSKQVFSHKLIVFAFESLSPFAILQSRVHEIWSSRFGTTRGAIDALTYNPTQVFRTFPFPERFETSSTLEQVGDNYESYRSDLLLENQIGLTAVYAQFNNPNEQSDPIAELRRLHDEVDRTVLEAYGWSDIDATPVFEREWVDEDGNGPWRYRWSEPIRDQILARLLALNAERAAGEARNGLTVQTAHSCMEEAEDFEDFELEAEES